MLSSQRDLFSLPDDVHYLNCAYMSPLMKRVEEAGIEGMRRKRNPALVAAADFFTESEYARGLFAQLVNAPDPQRVAIIPSVSYGIATAALNLPRERGQNVVVAEGQFPSNLYAWRELCEREGLELRTVRPPQGSEGRGEGWNRRILESIDERTAIVALGNVHWVDGTRFDLERIGARARERQAALVVDGTQSVGALPFDVQRVQPDVLVCAAYKWLFGPYSIGFAYYGERFDGGVPLEQGWQARAGSEDFRSLAGHPREFQPGALRYDVGERSNFILLPMAIAALEQLLEWTPGAIQRYCRRITTELVGEARELGYAVEDDPWRGAHLLGMRAPEGMDLDGLQRRLEERKVFVSLRGSTLRVSPNVYNDAVDVDALREGLRDSA